MANTVITLTLTPGVVGYISAQYNYSDTIPDPNNTGQTLSNPVTQPQFAENVITGFVADVCKAQISQQTIADAQTAAATVQDGITAMITSTVR